jgi:hypothetical protein
MLKLTYTRKNDEFQIVTVLGDAEGIRDLYWQLTHNYKAQDGTEIGVISVTDLDGRDCIAEIMTRPHSVVTRLSRLDA